MNPYAIVSSGTATADAASLRARLMAWHDAMVAHERWLRSGHPAGVCTDECPHVDARALWAEVSALLGPRAGELAFLRSRALDAAPSPDQRVASTKAVTARQRSRSFVNASAPSPMATAER